MPFSLQPCLEQSKSSLLQQRLAKEGLEVFSRQTEFDSVHGYAIFRGGVRAKFGATILTTDELIVRDGTESDPPETVEVAGRNLSLRAKEAFAIGKVNVVDPDGSIQASNLWFTWDKNRISNPNEVTRVADLVEIRLGTAHIKADSMKMSLESWDFTKVAFWTGNWRTPLFRFDASSLHIVPERIGMAKDMKLSLLGLQLPNISRYTFSLDPRHQGFNLPLIGFRQGAGIGTSWVSSFAITDSSSIAASLAAYPSVQPTYSLSYSKSFVPKDNVGIGQFSISNQFGERSQFSFLTNIYWDSFSSAFDSMQVPKSLFSVNSTFNNETVDRATDRITNYSLPLEIGLEQGGPLGKWAYLLQIKASRIVEAGDKSATRLALQGSTYFPMYSRGKLKAGSRIDAAARLDASSSGFIGAESGFSYDLGNELSFSSGAYGYKNVGTPLFAGDNFQTNQGYVVRGDWLGASTNISVMFRYDPTKGWFDKEYRLTQVAGPLEPVLVYRQSPRQYVLGIRFRTQDISKILKRRTTEQSGDKDK